MFLWRYPAGVLEVAVRGYDRRDIRVLEFVWVSDPLVPSQSFSTNSLVAETSSLSF